MSTEPTNEDQWDDDSSYQEWSETIERQNQQHQYDNQELKVIEMSHLTWSQALVHISDPKSEFNQKLRSL